MESWDRFYYAARFYRPKQIIHRLLSRAKGPLAASRINRLCARPGLKVRALLPHISEPVADGPRLMHDDKLVALRLLNREYLTGKSIDWRGLEKQIETRLGRFHLHYHEFLLPKYPDDRLPVSAEQIWNWIGRWIDTFSGSTTTTHSMDAWHPYVISRRIPVWVKLFSQHPPEGAVAERVLTSLTAQARWLRKNIEFDLGGNHLIQNLRGLAVASAFFDGPEADEWLRTVQRWLSREIEEQVLQHGEHFERSPMYHVDVLLALADIRDAFQAAFGKPPKYLEDAINRMAAFLGEILHPDGQIPLFGDSTLDLTPSPRQVFTRLGMDFPNLEPQDARSGPVGDYWIYREGGHFLIFDAGPVGPDHLPAHAHADLLTVEASWGGKRLLVDAGVYDYEESAERAFCRSTAAHNTLEINGQNQCDVWSRFRMGRRGWPGKLHSGTSSGLHWGRGTHNAYRHLGVPEVGRLLLCGGKNGWFIVDWIKSKNECTWTSRYRIGPEWGGTYIADGILGLQSGDLSLVATSLSEGCRLTVERTSYCSQFHTTVEINEFRNDGQAKGLNGLVFALASHPQSLPKAVIKENRLQLITLSGEHISFELH